MRNLLCFGVVVAGVGVACGGGGFTAGSDDSGLEAAASGRGDGSGDMTVDGAGDDTTDAGESGDSTPSDGDREDAEGSNDSAAVKDSGEDKDSGEAHDSGRAHDAGTVEAGACTGAGQCDANHPCPSGGTCCSSIVLNRSCGSCSVSRICPG